MESLHRNEILALDNAVKQYADGAYISKLPKALLDWANDIASKMARDHGVPFGWKVRFNSVVFFRK